MAAWHPRNDDAPTFTSLNLPCPHRKRTRAATRIQATYRGGQTRDRVVRKALAEFHDICNRISTECSGISAAADPLTFHRPNDLPRCFGVDALAAAAAFAAATAIATPTATATAATATITTATAAAATAAATAAAATAATAAAATPAPATAAAATATGDTVTTGTAAVSPPAPRSEDGDDPPAAAAVNGNNENSELRRAVNPLSTSSARKPPPPQAERARNACRAHHGSDGRTGTAGGSREKRPADVVVDIGDKEADKEDKEKEELEERAGHRRQHDGGFGGGGGGRGVDGGGGEGDGGGGRRERVGGGDGGSGEGGECLFTYSDGEEDDEELEDSLAAASSSTGGDGAAGLLPPSLLPTSPASNSANRFVSATAAARDQHHTHHHHHHGSGGGSGDGEQQHKQQGKGGRGEAARDDNGREVGDLVRTPAAASSDRGQERLSRAKDGGVSGVIGIPGGGSRSDRSDVSGLSPRRTSPSPPPVAAEVNPSVGGDCYRNEALVFSKDGVVEQVVGKRGLRESGAPGAPEMPEPLDGGDDQDKDERGEAGRAPLGVERVTVAVELATSLLPSSLSSGVEEGANESDQLPLLIVSDATTSTATASATATAAAASYGIPSAVLNDGELYDIGGGSGGLWGSRDGLRMALSSSFASSCETTPLKGEAISAAAVTAATAAAPVAVESDYPDAAENVMEASGAVAGYWGTPALDGVSYKRNSGGGRGVGEDAAGIARDLTKTWGLLYRDDDERQASEGREGPRASTVTVTAAVDDNVYLDREISTKIADASSSELEEELRRIREALANRVRYLQQPRKREEIGGAAERDPCDVARRLLERR